jgi:hypothetical protein
MKFSIPSGLHVKELLLRLTPAQLQRLETLSGVPVTTIRAIRNHPDVPNPGIETVRKFLPFVEKVRA